MNRKVYEVYVINDNGDDYPEYILSVDTGINEQEVIDRAIKRKPYWLQENIITSIRVIAELKQQRK